MQKAEIEESIVQWPQEQGAKSRTLIRQIYKLKSIIS
jgi:hypothetical protein